MRRSTSRISFSWSMVSKNFWMSISTTYRWPRPPIRRIASSASVALLLGRKPYEHSLKSASKIGSMTSLAAACTTRSRTVGIPNGRFVPSGFGMYWRLTGCGQYRPVRRRCCTSWRNSSTPSCSIIDSVSPSTPAAPLFALTRFHASARTSPRQIRSYSAWKRRLPASLGSHVKPALELSDFVRRVVGPLGHALALTPSRRRDQSRALSLQRLSPPSSLLRAPRTPSRHDAISPSAYTRRLRPTWAAEEGLPSSASGCPYVPSSLPRERPAPLRPPRAVCCLRRDMIGSATPPFGFLSHEAAKFTLSHWARRFAPLARGHTASRRAFDAPLRRADLSSRPEPATRRSGAYRGGTCTRKSDAAPRTGPSRPGSRSGRTTPQSTQKALTLPNPESIVEPSKNGC